MSMPGLSMKKIREILRLKFELQLSNRDIALSLKVSPSTVSLYTKAFGRKGLSWSLVEKMDDDTLHKLFFPTEQLPIRRDIVQPDYPIIYKELKKKGVTLQLLWEEYYSIHGDRSYGRTQFCEHYRTWLKKLNITMRHLHKAGDKLFIDYCGPTIPIIDSKTGEIRQAQIFVCVMGASNYTYAEATWSQTLPDWISSHVRAFTFFGGVPALLVPDNLRSGVTKICRYEPDINPTYADLAAYYGVAVLPARPRKPRDKAKVEVGVQVVERWILAKLRHQKFFSLQELNAAIAHLLVTLNNKPFKKLPGSRASQFEELDKPALKPLPRIHYTYAEFKKARLGVDYHIEVDGHYYSAPYQLAKETVEVRISDGVIEIFHKNNRVASHLRSYKKGTHTTIAEHMPIKHQKQAKWSISRLLNWAQKIGSNTARLTQHLIEKKSHPEQAYRACLGLLNLAKNYGEVRLELACHRAVYYNTLSRQSVKIILEKNLDKQTLPEPQAEKKLPSHENIRGPEYFTSTI